MLYFREQKNAAACLKGKMKQKIIVFGAGFLGKRIAEEFSCAVVSRKDVDVSQVKQIDEFLEREKPDVIINAVGKTGGPGEIGIDWCETHKIETIESNIAGAVNLSVAAAKKNIYFVHLGSGCIYEGDNKGRGWSEKDEPNFYGPQFYAMTKIDAEKILKHLPGLIIRLRMPIDDRSHERNLVDKLLKYPHVINIQNSMTTIPDMIPALKILIDRRREGIYNFTNPRIISAAEIMEMYSKIVKPHKFDILLLEDLNKITKGKRSNCYLNTEKLEAELRGTGAEMPEIHKAVEVCLKKYKTSLKA